MRAAFGGYIGPKMKKDAPEWAAKTRNIKRLPMRAAKAARGGKAFWKK
jgi:hypothetical protein